MTKAKNLPAALVGALVTRFTTDTFTPTKRDIEAALRRDSCTIKTYGRLRRVDTSAGDTIRAITRVPLQEDGRDASYVRVSHCFSVCHELSTSLTPFSV
jgi:hypothetical protein